MIWAIIIVIFILIFGVIVRYSRRLLYGGNFLYDLTDEKYLSKIRRFLATSETPQRGGAGVAIDDVKTPIEKAYKILHKKVKSGQKLFEYEKWLYENHFKIEQALAMDYDVFYDLPHVSNEPRILQFAKKVISYSGGELSATKIEAAFAEADRMQGFGYDEYVAAKAAFCYAILLKIAEVSQKCVKYHKFFVYALKLKNIVKRYVNDNVYVYYVIKTNAALSEKLKNYMDKNGLRYDDVDYAFSNILVENLVIAEKLIGSLLRLDDVLLNVKKCYSPQQVLEKSNSFSVTDKTGKQYLLSRFSQHSSSINVSESDLAEKLLKFESDGVATVPKSILLCDRDFKKLIKTEKLPCKPNLRPKIAVALFVVFQVLGSAAVSVAMAFLGAKAAVVAMCGVFASFALMSQSYYVAIKAVALFCAQNYVLRMQSRPIPEECKTTVVVPCYVSNVRGAKEIAKKMNELRASQQADNVGFLLLCDFPSATEQTVATDGELQSVLKQNLDGVGLMIRKRVFSDGKWCARERKRGALEDLHRYYEENAANLFEVCLLVPEKPQFVVVLDEDSSLLPGEIKRAILQAMHPENADVELFAFSPANDMFSLKTKFSMLFSDGSGATEYPCFGSAFYAAFGKGVFTGKGLYRLSAFYDKLTGRFAEKKLLSHDVLEGSLVSTVESDVRVFEDVPQNLSQYLTRRKRWAVGDVGLGYFLHKTGRSIPIEYKLLIFLNAAKKLSAAAVVALFATACFFAPVNCLIVASSVMFIKPVFAILKVVFGSKNVRARYFLKTILKQIVKLVLTPVFVVVDSALDTYAFFAAIIKVYGGFNMLCWKTFGSGKSAVKQQVSTNDATLLSAAERAYRFFLENTVSGLVADNVNYVKGEKRASYTSPTNVGFSLVAEVCAVILGFSKREESQKRTLEILQAVENLDKFKGNLFNWYDIKTKKPLSPRFVSSVDSGNFVASLITASAFFGGKVAKICEKMIKETDLSALYDNNRQQFYIGYNLESGKFEGHYDIKISEARLLNYVYCALQKTSENYFGMQNIISPVCGNTLYSWGGTAFEYLMPEIFLSTPKNSLVGSSAFNAAKVQQKTAFDGLWGISECGYADVDECGNYRYRAFGVNALGLKSAANEAVVAPYACALCLEFIPNAARQNLLKLKQIAYGKYGYFEAVDMRNGEKKAVREVMAHHSGMLLAAICNYLKGQAVRNIFMSDSRMGGAKLLLTEPKILTKPLPQKDNGFLAQTKNSGEFCVTLPKNQTLPRFNLLKTDDYGVAINDFGEGYSYSKGVYVTRFREDMFRPSGSFFVVRDEDDLSLYSPTFSPLKRRGDYKTEFSDCRAYFENGNLSEEVFCPQFFDGETRLLTLKNTAKQSKTYTIFFYSEPLLGSMEADYAHRCFNNLFFKTTSEVDVNGTLTMTACRRFPTNDEKAYMTLTAKGIEGATGVCDRFDYIGKNRTLENAVIYQKLPSSSFGDVSEPCLAFYGEVNLKPDEQKTVEVTLGFATDEKSAIRLLKRPKSAYFGRSLRTPAFVNDNVKCNLSGEARKYFNTLFAAIVYVPYSDGKLKRMVEDETGLSKTITCGFTKKALYFGFTEKTEQSFAEFSEGFELLKSMGAKCSLVVGYVESDFYGGKTYRKILSKVKSSVVGKDVFIIDLSGDGKDVEKLCFRSFCGFSKMQKSPVEKPKNRKKTPKMPDIKGEFDVGNGSYLTVDGHVAYVSKGLVANALPYCEVVAETDGGFVATDNGAGHTWFLNSRECKVTVWDSDTVSPPVSERFTLVCGGKSWLLTENAATVFEKGAVSYRCKTDEAEVRLTEYMLENGTGKRFEVEVKSLCSLSKKFCFITDFDLSLGVMPNGGFTVIEKTKDGIYAKNVQSGISCFLRLPEGTEAVTDAGLIKSRVNVGDYYDRRRKLNLKCFASAYNFELSAGECKKFCYTLYPTPNHANSSVDSGSCKRMQVEKWANLNPVKVCTGEKWLDLLSDNLPYQTLACRIYARAAFYQVGGAFGFRDVLQDALSAIWFDKTLAREIILTAASKVYEEGDAVHWWHNTGYGIRTRISDDRLFLCYALTEYISATGDGEILKEKVPYLTSKPLSEFEQDRFEKLVSTDYAETVYEHVLKTFAKTANLGENGLIKVYGGDWNDALNDVGDGKKGESVWLSMFFYKCLRDFSEYVCDTKTKLKMLEFAENLKKAVDLTFENGYYKRMVTKRGEWLGSKENDVIKLDVISQAWAVLSTIAPSDNAKSALQNALKLVSDDGIIRLLWPPANDESSLGYISKYPEGVRENGGQYTHGAIWLISALFKSGNVEKGYELLKGISPINQNLKNKNYRAEPYVLAADVYTSKNDYGRAGWSWYTGSASWCYKVILEDLFGLKLVSDKLKISPKSIPSALFGASVEVKRNGGKIVVKYLKGQNGIRVDGVNVIGNDVFDFKTGKTTVVEVFRR